MFKLIQLEQNYLDLFKDKYNINPAAGSRLGAKHTEETKALLSKFRKENPSFLNKTHSEEYINELRIRMSGFSNHMYGKPVTKANKKLISDMFRKDVYLYDANTLELISKFDKHKDLIQELNISSKTIVKYKDSGLVYKDRYIISSMSPEEIGGSKGGGSKGEGSGALNSAIFPMIGYRSILDRIEMLLLLTFNQEKDGVRASFPRIRFDQLMSFC